MEANVIDTNVLITANGDVDHPSLECALNCLKLLEHIVESGGIVLLDAEGGGME